MKTLKKLFGYLMLAVIMASFSKCSTTQKLQKQAPTQFGEVYCESWTAGARGGGSGINLFIVVMDKTIALDSVYFRGKVAKLVVKPSNDSLYIGRFKTAFNQHEDIIMSSDSKEEYNNKLPEKPVSIPFELKNDECVVSFKKGDKTMYYKITTIKQRELLNYPMSPPQ